MRIQRGHPRHRSGPGGDEGVERRPHLRAGAAASDPRRAGPGLACAGVDRRPDRRDRRRDRANRRLPRRGGHAGRSRRQPAARLEPAGPGRAPADRPDCPHRLHRADRRRERRRQGAGGAADPPMEPAQSRPLHRRELRRDRRVAARSRAVRHRGPHRDRRPRTPRQARTGQRRLAVPRRGRRPVAGRAGQAAARAAGVLGRAGRRTPDQEGRHPDHGGHQPQPVGAGDEGTVPRRSLLPPERAGTEGAAAARAARGHPRPRAGLSRAPRGTGPAVPDVRGRARGAPDLRVARQRARAGTGHRARHHPRRGRRDPVERSAAGAERALQHRAAGDRGRREHAGVGEPLRQARPRALRQQQAQGVPRAGHQLPHAAGLPALHAAAAGRAEGAAGARSERGRGGLAGPAAGCRRPGVGGSRCRSWRRRSCRNRPGPPFSIGREIVIRVDATSPPLPEAIVPPGPRARGGQPCSPTPTRRAR